MRGRVMITVARREWRAALTGRWFWIYGGAMTLLGGGLLWLASGMVPQGIPLEVAGGRALMATVNLLGLLVPLMGLTAGAQCLARERDRRTLGYLLAQPVSRAEVLLGKLLGNGLALGAAIGGSTGVLILLSVFLAVPLPPFLLAEVAVLGWLLALATLGLGTAIGAAASGLVAAQGITLGAWLLLILLGDLGLMGLVTIREVPVQVLLALTFVNPVHQFRVAAVALFRPTLEVLGPVGLYAEQRLGGSLIPVLVVCLAVWTVGVVLVAMDRFQRSRVI